VYLVTVFTNFKASWVPITWNPLIFGHIGTHLFICTRSSYVSQIFRRWTYQITQFSKEFPKRIKEQVMGGLKVYKIILIAFWKTRVSHTRVKHKAKNIVNEAAKIWVGNINGFNASLWMSYRSRLFNDRPESASPHYYYCIRVGFSTAPRRQLNAYYRNTRTALLQRSYSEGLQWPMQQPFGLQEPIRSCCRVKREPTTVLAPSRSRIH